MWREKGCTAFCVVNTTQRTNRTNPKCSAVIQQLDTGKEAEESLSYKMAVYGSGREHCLPRP